MGEGCSAGLKSIVDHHQSVKYKSTTIKTLRPARTETSSKDRSIGAFSIGSIGLTILGKLSFPKKHKPIKGFVAPGKDMK